VLQGGPVVIGGDINVEKPNDPDAVRLADLLASFDLVQHVAEPTHQLGGTLNLVMTFAGCQVTSVAVDSAGMISDQGIVTLRVLSQ